LGGFFSKRGIIFLGAKTPRGGILYLHRECGEPLGELSHPPLGLWGPSGKDAPQPKFSGEENVIAPSELGVLGFLEPLRVRGYWLDRMGHF